MKRKIFAITTALLCMCSTINTAFATSAISVPNEAKGTAAMSKALAQQLEQKKANEKYLAEAKYYANSTQQEAQKAQASLAAATQRLNAAKDNLINLEKQKELALHELAQAQDIAQSNLYYGQAAVQALQNATEKRLAADQTVQKYNSAKQELEDALLVYNDNLAYTKKAQDYANNTLQDLNRLQAAMQNAGGLHFMSVGSKLYSWSADGGIKGYQFLQPLSIGYWSKDFSYSLFTNYVWSNSKSAGESGSYKGFMDTTFFVNKQQELGKITLDYRLSINIPTGKSEMNWGQRYARFNEDIAEIEQFGKGWQFTPGIYISYKPYEKDTWTIGTDYIYSRSYDPTFDVVNDTLNPGGEWSSFLRYQHIGEKWQVVGKIMDTTYGRSELSNGSTYRTKDKLEYQITVNTILNKKQDLMFYYWLERQNHNNLPFSTTTSLAHYYGVKFTNKVNNKSTIKISIDRFYTNGSRYLGIYNTYDFFVNPIYASRYVDGRKKITLAIGYDYQIDNKSSLNFDIQYFKMHDGKSSHGDPERNYKGFNVFLMYNRNL